MDFVQGNIKSIKAVTDQAACCQACQEMTGCGAGIFTASKACVLKSNKVVDAGTTKYGAGTVACFPGASGPTPSPFDAVHWFLAAVQSCGTARSQRRPPEQSQRHRLAATRRM